MKEINVKAKTVQRKIESIRPYENNPRKNDAAVPRVAASIRRFGFRVPIVVDTDGVIVTGHTRYKAAKELGLTTVPVIVADDLTPDEVKAYRLADNKVAEAAEWDEEKLDVELLDLQDSELLETEDFTMEDFGFDLIEPDEPERISGDGVTGRTQREDLSDRIEAQYQVIVECDDEGEQEDLFNRLEAEGYRCHVLTL